MLLTASTHARTAEAHLKALIILQCLRFIAAALLQRHWRLIRGLPCPPLLLPSRRELAHDHHGGALQEEPARAISTVWLYPGRQSTPRVIKGTAKEAQEQWSGYTHNGKAAHVGARAQPRESSGHLGMQTRDAIHTPCTCGRALRHIPSPS